MTSYDSDLEDIVTEILLIQHHYQVSKKQRLSLDTAIVHLENARGDGNTKRIREGEMKSGS